MNDSWWCWCYNRLVRVAAHRSSWRRQLLYSRRWLRRHELRTSNSRRRRLSLQLINLQHCRKKILNSRCGVKMFFYRLLFGDQLWALSGASNDIRPKLLQCFIKGPILQVRAIEVDSVENAFLLVNLLIDICSSFCDLYFALAWYYSCH